MHRSAKLAILVALLAGSSCVNRAYVKEGNHLIRTQKIKSEGPISEYELEQLYAQQKNRRILGLTPYVYIYEFAERFYDKEKIREQLEKDTSKINRKIRQAPADSKKELRLLKKKQKKLDKARKKLKEGNFIMRAAGEKPVFFSDSLAKVTAKRMEKYIFKLGYFNNTVNYVVDTTRSKKYKVFYHVIEKKPYYINRLEYETSVPLIRQLITKDTVDSPLKVGKVYHEEDLIGEQERIANTLRNNGFFGFSRDYVFFQVDSTVSITDSAQHQVAIKLIIKNPKDREHKQYYIDSITLKINSIIQEKVQILDTHFVEGVRFIYQADNYKTGPLRHKILVDTGELYQQDRLVKSQATLSSLDMFTFVNMEIDTSGNKVHVMFNASRIKRFQTSEEVGLQVSQATPGPFIDINFRIRNPTKRLDILKLSGRYSVEGAISSFSDNIQTYVQNELTGKVEWIFPTIFFPGKKLRYWLDEFNPRTNFSASVSDIRNTYFNQTITRGAMTYELYPSPNNNEIIQINPIDISFTYVPDDKFSDEYRAYINDLAEQGNPFIENSFQTSLNTSINVTYTYNNYRPNKRNKAFYFSTTAEYGGLVPYLISAIESQDQGGDDTIFGSLFFQYARASADVRLYLPTNQFSMFVFRTRSGVVVPHNVSNTVQPQKFFTSGGTNSIRAWRPLEVGLGTYEPENNPDFIVPQLGEFLLEGNAELRVDVFDFVEAAWFLDIGNVWLLKPDSSRPGGEITTDFYRNLFIGTGPGLRFDFTFVIIRFDLGLKLRDPGLPENKRWLLDQYSLDKPLGPDPVINFGVGYPF